MCFSCEWCEEIKNRPLLADDFSSWMVPDEKNEAKRVSEAARLVWLGGIEVN